jgi:hypothetical protein
MVGLRGLPTLSDRIGEPPPWSCPVKLLHVGTDKAMRDAVVMRLHHGARVDADPKDKPRGKHAGAFLRNLPRAK